MSWAGSTPRSDGRHRAGTPRLVRPGSQCCQQKPMFLRRVSIGPALPLKVLAPPALAVPGIELYVHTPSCSVSTSPTVGRLSGRPAYSWLPTVTHRQELMHVTDHRYEL